MNKNKKTLIRVIICACLFVASVIVVHFIAMPWYGELALFCFVYALIGFDIVLEAIGGIGRGQIFDENFLMVLATVGAFATKQYPEAVAVMLLYQIGELFQRYAVGKSRGSISELMNLRPDTVNVMRDGQLLQVLPEEISVGEIIQVKPGERVPLDGVIVEGKSAIDTSALTGEAAPRYGVEGTQILSGMIATSGVLQIKVEKEYYDSTISKILDMVENASGKKAKTEKFITKFSRYYTPVVVFLALAMAVIMPLFDGNWSDWISYAMNFLVVSCPCALVISIPMSFFMGIGAASKQGVLVKGGNYLELLDKVDTFVFDKTGTLTRGVFSVTNVMPAENCEQILRYASIAEQGSLHPIAKAILNEENENHSERWEIEENAGYGITAQRDGNVIHAGSYRFMQKLGIALEAVDSTATIVYVSYNMAYLGYIEISDTLKDDAQQTLVELKKQGSKTVMLTGDQKQTASRIACEAGVDDFEAELLPQDKVNCVEKLINETKGSVAFVGDGINDAPVLMRADLGIAMGAIGTDAAIEAADVVLMHDKLSALPVAKKIAKKTVSIVKQNIIFALGIKLAVLLLTPFGLVSVWLAIFADVGVAVLAVLNAMRAGKV